MREIKFKAKRVDDGVWVYGSYTAMREDDHNECFITKPHKIYHRIWQWESGDWNMGRYANYEVIPETVCEFTGLKDKNGEKIFEGDKFQFYEHEDYYMKSFTGVVTYKEGCFGYEVIDSPYSPFYPFSEFMEDDDFWGYIEVIGNIHDKIK